MTAKGPRQWINTRENDRKGGVLYKVSRLLTQKNDRPRKSIDDLERVFIIRSTKISRQD
jgi:hypothetical protein